MNLSHFSSDADSSPSPNVEQPLYSPLTESDSETDFGSINDELDDDYGTSINAVDTTTTSGFIVYEKRKATGKPAISFELQTSSRQIRPDDWSALHENFIMACALETSLE